MTSPKASVLLLVMLCQAAFAKTTMYEFVPGQSTVIYQNWSWGYVKETRSIAGNCRLTVDPGAGLARFDQVDAELSEEIWCFDCYDNEPDLRTKSLGVLFHMSELKSTDVNDTAITFVYQRNIPTFPDADVHLTLTFMENSVHLTGRFYEACCDCGQFDLDAVAVRKTTLYYVDDDGPADFATIQAAIDDANDGDVIIVKPGTYTGPGNRDIDFKGKAITVRSTDPNDPNIFAATVIDCNGTKEEPHRGFYFHSREVEDSVVDGFAIINGYARGPWSEQSQWSGGGILIQQSSPTIKNCIIMRNTSFLGTGGGIRASGGVITNCTLKENYAFELPGYGPYGSGGGGISCGGNTVVTNCTIASNTGSPYAGGVMCTHGKPTLRNCLIVGNSASLGGGIDCQWWGHAVISNCTINGNSANHGGAISCLDSNPTLTNCILWGNTAARGPEICSACVYGSYSIAVSYSDVQGGQPAADISPHCILNWAVGSIDADPRFTNPGYWADANDPNLIVEPNDANATWVNGDYHLKSQAGRWEPSSGSWVKDDVTSPCIDAGDSMFPIGHEPFPNGGIINMGAYGGTAEASKSYFGKPVCATIIAGDINGDCVVNFADFRLMALHWLQDNR